MSNVFHVVALPRSGHHAVAIWLACQDSTEYDHDMKMLNKLHYASKDILLVQLAQYGSPETIWDDAKVRKYLERDCPIIINDDVPGLPKRHLDVVPLELRERVTVQSVLVVRDFFNHQASVAKHSTVKPCAAEMIAYWKCHAKEAVGDTDLGQFDACVVFDSWFVHRKYRKALCAKLGLEFTDRGLNYVNDAGGGSSFDKRKYDGRAQEMGVVCRHNGLRKTEDAEIQSVNDRLYDELENLP